ncbi:hypothetical protein Bphyt_7377 (plasmid) [Paraburkholderia phytofirmans PsJN]|uniref:Uncharacterized protein n=1 Tax=Paraburkholderia phytofirmans (strain DSM 17436 / LMG 22146 / PsJN) TaxID=398527 RepID=B2THA6_PARPJ|nr:hypothetical protein Bphyt_7377 [Paraburkholderia phytofirmans PsJN]
MVSAMHPRYTVLSSGVASSAADALTRLESKVNEALQEGATLSGGVNVVYGLAGRVFTRYGYEAFQAVLIDQQ